jgi:hypothetical protein
MGGRICLALRPEMSSLIWTCPAIGRTCPAIGRICPVRTYPLGKISINHVLLIETLSNLTKGYSSTLEITYSRIMTYIIGYESRSQKLEIET